MVRVITYGTYDLLHRGHIRLLERAKALGDYLIVGVTADGFDRLRGKINVQQSLMERIEAVKATGIADKVIVEEYEGQKIDDIQRLNVDIFTVGSDWKGHFDYLNEYCRVIYLDRTKGVSSSELRAQHGEIRLGLIGSSPIVGKVINESKFVNGLNAIGVYCNDDKCLRQVFMQNPEYRKDLDELLEISDALYIISRPQDHYAQIKVALEKGIHVLCESPITISQSHYSELLNLSHSNNLVLMDSIKTAYSMAYHRLLLLVKSGVIGEIVSVDSVCTSQQYYDMLNKEKLDNEWNSICSWGPTGLLPIFQILGGQYKECSITSRIIDERCAFDDFTKITFTYPHAVASTKVGRGVKSEGELIISGTKGYIYVPAPWWKTDYFEIRFENPVDNKRYFYQLDGEGIRYELVSFVNAINGHMNVTYVDSEISRQMIGVVETFYQHHYTKI